VVKLLGLDAFSLLLGQSPGDITGAGEGALLGGATGPAGWFAARSQSLRRSIATAALLGGAAGVLIVLSGGRLMAGSLALLGGLPNSRLRLDRHRGAGRRAVRRLSRRRDAARPAPSDEKFG
jgi:hypothetical protein